MDHEKSKKVFREVGRVYREGMQSGDGAYKPLTEEEQETLSAVAYKMLEMTGSRPWPKTILTTAMFIAMLMDSPEPSEYDADGKKNPIHEAWTMMQAFKKSAKAKAIQDYILEERTIRDYIREDGTPASCPHCGRLPASPRVQLVQKVQTFPDLDLRCFATIHCACGASMTTMPHVYPTFEEAEAAVIMQWNERA